MTTAPTPYDWPCSWCGDPATEQRRVGTTHAGGRTYPRILTLCDQCWEMSEREREASIRG